MNPAAKRAAIHSVVIRALARLALIVVLATAATAGAKTITRSFSGRTSQQKAVLLRISGSRLDFDVSFNQRCYSRANRFLGNVHGSFEFRSIQALEAGGQGRFAMRFRQRHTKVKGFKQYFRAVYDVTGTVGKSRASGGFSAVSQYYMLSGTPLGTCRTGRLGWSAKLRR